jgi:CheY-like chemotaxis protein/anti-sigma regulatory factor (Ser/Thr protein kinase)
MEEKHLHVDVTTPDELVMVLGDGTRLTQALGNLLHNAAKFSSEHQKIEVKMSLPESGESVEVSVRDYGKGMGEDTAQDLFKVLPRRQTFRQAGEAGLGLGLVVVRNLIELHGGEIRAESSGAGKGALFTIILPLADSSGQLEGSTEGKSHSRHEFPQCRVLLVEDDLAAARSLELLISLENQEVKMARTGREALEIATKWQPEIIICDIRLPDTSGLQLIGKMKELEGLENARFVGLSGFSNADTRQEALENGFHDYLVKPPTPERLFESLFPQSTH